MARFVTIEITSDPNHIGIAATQDDLDQYADNLKARIESELWVSATVNQQDGIESPRSTDAEVSAWLDSLTEQDHLDMIPDGP